MSDPMTRIETMAASAPVHEMHPEIVPEESGKHPEAGIALCLSGGGYRAMLFHTGAILRLNELGVLKQLSRVSSVSGGSITAGVLGMNWAQLAFDDAGRASNLRSLFVEPIQQMARTTIDRGSVLGGVFLPGSVNDRIVANYREVLFGSTTMQDLPLDEVGPRFVFNATSVQSGALVRMSRPYMADYRVGMIRNPTILLAEAVAASSAFPPVLSPAEIDVDPSDFVPDRRCDLQYEPFTESFILSDGGVYDNLGLETAWKRYKTILVSDGGGRMPPEPVPAGDWARHSKRVLDIIDNQVRSLRKRNLIASYVSKARDGAFWGIRTDIADYALSDAMPVPRDRALRLANVATRLRRMTDSTQQQLMNWGYAVCDAAMRRYAAEYIASAASGPAFPFDGVEV